MKINQLLTESQMTCSECGGPAFSDLLLAEKKDACYNKVRSRYKVWPSAYASGALVQCRKKGAANWGNKSKNEDVAEGAGNIGNSIKALYQKIYRAGDDEVEYFYNDSPIFAQYWDEYEGDLDSIVAEVDPSELQIMLDELESYVQQANLAEADYSPMAKDSMKADKIRSLENLIAIAREQGRQLRVQELELELKKLQGVAESYPKHQDLSGISTEKLKAYLAKQAKQSVSGEGSQVKRVQAELQSRKLTGDPAPQHYRDELAKDAAEYRKKQGVAEGMLDNPGQEDSPVAQAIIRRILMQRTDLLAKYGPERVGAAVDEVADFVGDVEEIGSSDVSGWVQHVERTLNNMNEDYNPEYDDEAGMADNNLETLQRAVKGIDDLIDAGDNLPEWCQEKIANAKSMLVAVWDYMYSEEASDEVDAEVDAMFEAMDRLAAAMAQRTGTTVDMVWESFEAMPDHVLWATAQHQLQQLNEDWQKVNKRDKTAGMSRKAVKAYRRENPGSKLQTAVTTKPSKLKKGSKASKRRKSFCARMRGMKKSRASAKTKRNPNSPINKALRRWNC